MVSNVKMSLILAFVLAVFASVAAVEQASAQGSTGEVAAVVNGDTYTYADGPYPLRGNGGSAGTTSYGSAGYAAGSYGSAGYAAKSYGSAGYAASSYGSAGYAARSYGSAGHTVQSYGSAGTQITVVAVETAPAPGFLTRLRARTAAVQAARQATPIVGVK